MASKQLLAKRIPYVLSALAGRTTAVEIATVQYQAGRRDLLWVSQLQAEQLVAEQAVIKLRSAQGVNRIRLYLAAGGNFYVTPTVILPVAMPNDREI